MNARQTFSIVVLVASSVFRVADGSGEEFTGAPRSPIATLPVSNEVLDSVEAAATKPLGFALRARAPLRVELRRLTDEVEFGAPLRDRLAWVASYRGITLETSRGDTVLLDLEVAYDVGSGELLLAHTPLKDESVRPVMTPRNPDDEAKRAGWSFERLEESPTSDAVDVMAAIWGRRGFDPGVAGQVILRPRRLTSTYPRDPDTGQLKYDSTPIWIVELRGQIIEQHRINDNYFTGFLALVEDGSNKLVRVRYMP